jgi:hypothetical protein
LRTVGGAREDDRARKDLRQPGKDNFCRSACVGVVTSYQDHASFASIKDQRCLGRLVSLFSTNTEDELFIVGVPEELFFDRENSQVGNFVGWSDLSWEIGHDFAEAVKEKQRRAKSQLFNTWGNFVARTGSVHFLVDLREKDGRKVIKNMGVEGLLGRSLVTVTVPVMADNSFPPKRIIPRPDSTTTLLSCNNRIISTIACTYITTHPLRDSLLWSGRFWLGFEME